MSKAFKKIAVTAVLSTCLISSFVTPAFAAVDASSLNNKIGNELQAEFNVTELDAVDTVVLSWDEDGTDLDLGSFDLLKGVEQTVTYHVSPGAENDDDLTVGVLLRMPDASVTAVQTLKVNGQAISSSFTDAGFTYYVLNEDLAVAHDAGAYSNTFDIAFNTTTEAGTPFEASLVAIDTAVSSIVSEISMELINSELPVGTTSGLLFYFTPSEDITNGTLSIQLDEGMEPIDVHGYGNYMDESGNYYEITANEYNAATKVLTLNIPEAKANVAYEVSFKNVNITDIAGDYSIKYTMDSDGSGNQYLPSEEMSLSYTVYSN